MSTGGDTGALEARATEAAMAKVRKAALREIIMRMLSERVSEIEWKAEMGRWEDEETSNRELPCL